MRHAASNAMLAAVRADKKRLQDINDDLLVVVKMFERYLANNGGDEAYQNADGTGWLTIARAAIAKAEGTS